jgi:hypothetical protein
MIILLVGHLRTDTTARTKAKKGSRLIMRITSMYIFQTAALFSLEIAERIAAAQFVGLYLALGRG